MLSEVNKASKDNPIFVSFLLYFVPTPLLILTPPFINFSKPLKPPPFILTPPFIMNLRVGRVGVLRRARPFAPATRAIQNYSALIQPHVDYCSSVRGGISNKLSEKKIRNSQGPRRAVPTRVILKAN